MDFDPRDSDSRDDDRFNTRGSKDRSNDDVDREDDLRLPDIRSRDRDENDARDMGRGPGDSRQSNDEHHRDLRDDARWPDRDRERPDRTFDPHEPFTRDLNLPRGLGREIVRDRDHAYTLRGSETRTLATVGAFRVISSRDLGDHRDRPADPRSGDLRHLREQGLIETVRVPGSREHAVALTKEGRSLLEHHRDRDEGHRQTFWDGITRERELEHDLQVYRAYEREAERLADRGARIERVLLDHELKREYQSWLHERDRDRPDYDGHPDRSDEEIRDWAARARPAILR
jgi:DNA-binding MarR family transcriptional regulator